MTKDAFSGVSTVSICAFMTLVNKALMHDVGQWEYYIRVNMFERDSGHA